MNRRKLVIAPDPQGMLEPWQEKVVREQIQKNSLVIDVFIEKVDLLANKERCPRDANTLLKLRKRLAISMDENDTFRKVLRTHLEVSARWKKLEELPDPLTYLVGQIKSRKQAAISQLCWK